MNIFDFSNPKNVWRAVKFAAIGIGGIVTVISEIAEMKYDTEIVKDTANDIIKDMTADAIKDQMNDVVKEECTKQLTELIHDMAKNA